MTTPPPFNGPLPPQPWQADTAAFYRDVARHQDRRRRWPWVAAACAAVAVLSGVVGFAASRAMVDETRVDLMERWDGLDAEGKATMCDGFNDLGMDAMTDTAMEAFADDDELSEIPRSEVNAWLANRERAIGHAMLAHADALAAEGRWAA